MRGTPDAPRPGRQPGAVTVGDADRGLVVTASPHGATLPPLGAKVLPPLPRKGDVPRTRLLRRLSQSTDKCLVLVTAGAGYGKSTALSQWARADPRPFAWVSLDADDNDAATFLRSVVSALGGAAGIPGEVVRELCSRDPSLFEVVVPLLCSSISSTTPFVLVLDDTHVIREPDVTEITDRLVRTAGPGSQVVLMGRETLRIPVGRLRVHERVEQIGFADLAMSEREARALLAGAGLSLPGEQVRSLVERTEGWPAGLHLAALAVRESGPEGGTGLSFEGDDRLVAEYFGDELLSRLPPDAVTFMTRTSIVDELSGPLCDRLLGTQGSGQELDRMERSNNMFLIPLDHRGGWYRYHHLFRELLRSELEARESDKIGELHRRASRWYEEQHLTGHAVKHAAGCGDLARAGRLILGSYIELVNCGADGTVGRWLQRFDDAELRGDVNLALAKAWFEMGQGNIDDAGHWIAVSERHGSEGPLADGSPDVAFAAAILRAVAGASGLERLAADAAFVMASGPSGSAWYPLACQLHGAALLLMGRIEEAREELVETEVLSRDMAPVHIVCLAQLAMIATEAGSWEEAASLADQAAAELAANNLHHFRLNAVTHAMSALVSARRGDAGSERSFEAQAMRLLASGKHLPDRIRVQALVLMAEAREAMGDCAAAAALAREADMAEQEIEPPLGSPFLSGRLRRLRDRLAAVPERDTRPVLTPAELRVLDLLPTHLTLGEIGDALYLSRNTVKTHAVSVYRKLGVSARGQAVDRARQLGVLDG
jgi:LuxR family maltose regulon positive regulatory protein